jgi:hypothetical protein
LRRCTKAENSAESGSAAAAARGFDASLTMLLAAPQRDPTSISLAIRRRIEVEVGRCRLKPVFGNTEYEIVGVSDLMPVFDVV